MAKKLLFFSGLRYWRFEPAMKDGHAVPFEIAVEVDFHLY